MRTNEYVVDASDKEAAPRVLGIVCHLRFVAVAVCVGTPHGARHLHHRIPVDSLLEGWVPVVAAANASLCGEVVGSGAGEEVEVASKHVREGPGDAREVLEGERHVDDDDAVVPKDAGHVVGAHHERPPRALRGAEVGLGHQAERHHGVLPLLSHAPRTLGGILLPPRDAHQPQPPHKDTQHSPQRPDRRPQHPPQHLERRVWLLDGRPLHRVADARNVCLDKPILGPRVRDPNPHVSVEGGTVEGVDEGVVVRVEEGVEVSAPQHRHLLKAADGASLDLFSELFFDSFQARGSMQVGGQACRVEGGFAEARG
mmetsp:Transcript_2548/g.6125  ORF Transcript_2548/g.6125 Transcript_2548/m.6125 type:complete len:313 (-) Transcript_2548:117-1055(-)